MEGTANDVSTANESPSVETLTETAEASRTTSRATSGPARPAVPANIQAQENGVQQHTTNNATGGDLYQHVNNLIQEQQRLSVSAVPNGNNVQLSQVSWSDPQIHLSSTAGKSTPNYFDICDFVQASIEEEVVLGSQGVNKLL